MSCEVFDEWNEVKKRTQGTFFYNFSFLDDKTSSALLVQAKTFDVKRLDRKIGTINKTDFEKLEIKFKSLMKL